VQTSAYSAPHLAVAFNSGCSQHDTTTWEHTIRVLVKNGTPTVFTVRDAFVYGLTRLTLGQKAYNRDEAEAEAAILRRLGARLAPALGPCKNPWGSLNLRLEPVYLSGAFSINGWLAGGFK
jgi:splicing suppressor protein 51